MSGMRVPRVGTLGATSTPVAAPTNTRSLPTAATTSTAAPVRAASRSMSSRAFSASWIDATRSGEEAATTDDIVNRP